MLPLTRCDDLPAEARPGFRVELQHFMLFGWLIAAIESTVVSAVAHKTFGAPDWLTSITWGLPVAASVASPLWSAMLRGRSPRRGLLKMVAGVSLCSASVALTPMSWGLWAAGLFALQVAVIHVLMTGILAARSEIWRGNYDDATRGRATGRLLTLRALLTLIGGVAINAAFDVQADLYRIVYPLTAMLGLASLLPLRKLPLALDPRASRPPPARFALDTVRGELRAGFAVLRADARFRRYMVAQFLLGAANFFTDAALVAELLGGLGYSYTWNQMVMTVIPSVVMLWLMPYFGRDFDRYGVVRFRLANSATWTASYVVTATAMLSAGGHPWLVGGLLILGRVLNGAGRGGGTIAWNLGHLYFARPELADRYLSVHVFLTGVRGIITPPLAAVCTVWLGAAAYLIPILLSATACAIFVWIDRIEGRERSAGST